METRSRKKQRQILQTPGIRANGPNQLTSPSSRLDDMFQRNQPRSPSKLSKRPLRHYRTNRPNGRNPQLTGYLGTIPQQALEQILGYLAPRELANLEGTCQYFIKSGITEKVAQHFLKEVPRAKGLKPDYKRGETSITLLNFVTGQSTAAAQSTAVSAGTYHTVALMAHTPTPTRQGQDQQQQHHVGPEYAMYAMGRGFHGQIGNGAYENKDHPSRIDAVDRDRSVKLYQGAPDDVQLAVVCSGSSHSAAISRRGELYTWGLASSGELGHGGWTPIEVPVPRMITSLGRTRVVSVCAGANHTMAISETGQLWTCGRGRHGQLGHGHFHDEGILIIVDALKHERIVSAAAGRAHSMALAADGKIFTWGDARHGQLGHQQVIPLLAGPNPQPIAIPVPQGIASLEPSKLRPPQRVTAIAAGGHHSMAVTVGGALLAFGSNKRGQLGTGDTFDRVTPTEIPLERMVALTTTTTAATPTASRLDMNPAGTNSNNTASGHGDGAGMATTTSLSSLLAESMPTTTTKTTTNSTELVRAMQVQCGMSHSCVLVQRQGRNELLTCGDNSYGQLGHDDRRERHSFTAVKSLKKARIVCIISGDWHNAAVTHNGNVYTWGRGDFGQLGHGDDCNRWAPKLLQSFTVVHPDRTLRRNRKPEEKTLLLPATEKKQGKRSGAPA